MRPPPLLLAVALAGCASAAPAAMPEAMVGTYGVDIAARGRSDADVMTVSLAAGGGVLLDFSAGISELRAQVEGSTQLDLLAQTVTVAHSTGAAEGSASGAGTIVDGLADLTIHLIGAGSDADGGAGATIDYHITGTRN